MKSNFHLTNIIHVLCCRNVAPAPIEINENGLLHSEGVGSSYLIFLHWWRVRVTLETICKVFCPKVIIIQKATWCQLWLKLDITHKCINTSGEHLQKYTRTPKKAKHIYIGELCTHICWSVWGHMYIFIYPPTHTHTHTHTHSWLNRRAAAEKSGSWGLKKDLRMQYDICYTIHDYHRSIWDLFLDQKYLCHRLESLSRHLN